MMEDLTETTKNNLAEGDLHVASKDWKRVMDAAIKV